MTRYITATGLTLTDGRGAHLSSPAPSIANLHALSQKHVPHLTIIARLIACSMTTTVHLIDYRYLGFQEFLGRPTLL